MITCPHCHFLFAGPDMPTHIEVGVLCPVCSNDMSATPILPVSGLQVAVKYLGSILGGVTLGVVSILILTPILEYMMGDFDGPMVGLMVGFGLILMFAIGSSMDTLMEKRVFSHKARWLLLVSPFLLTSLFWGILIFHMG